LECSILDGIFDSFQSEFFGVFLNSVFACFALSASSNTFESSTSSLLDYGLVRMEKCFKFVIRLGEKCFSFVFSVVDEASEAEILKKNSSSLDGIFNSIFSEVFNSMTACIIFSAPFCTFPWVMESKFNVWEGFMVITLSFVYFFVNKGFWVMDKLMNV